MLPQNLCPCLLCTIEGPCPAGSEPKMHSRLDAQFDLYTQHIYDPAPLSCLSRALGIICLMTVTMSHVSPSKAVLMQEMGRARHFAPRRLQMGAAEYKVMSKGKHVKGKPQLKSSMKRADGQQLKLSFAGETPIGDDDFDAAGYNMEGVWDWKQGQYLAAWTAPPKYNIPALVAHGSKLAISLPPRATRSFSIPLICTLYGVLSSSSHRLNLRFQVLALRQILCLLTPKKPTLEKLADRRTKSIRRFFECDDLPCSVYQKYVQVVLACFGRRWKVAGGRVRLPPAAGWKNNEKNLRISTCGCRRLKKLENRPEIRQGRVPFPFCFPRACNSAANRSTQKNWPGIRAKLVSEGRYFGRREKAPRMFPSAHHDTLQCTARYWNALQHAATLHICMCLLWPSFTARYV